MACLQENFFLLTRRNTSTVERQMQLKPTTSSRGDERWRQRQLTKSLNTSNDIFNVSCQFKITLRFIILYTFKDRRYRRLHIPVTRAKLNAKLSLWLLSLQSNNWNYLDSNFAWTPSILKFQIQQYVVSIIKNTITRELNYDHQQIYLFSWRQNSKQFSFGYLIQTATQFLYWAIEYVYKKFWWLMTGRVLLRHYLHKLFFARKSFPKFTAFHSTTLSLKYVI